jgi:hypothetical protein
MVQKPPIQLSQLTTCFYPNENFDYALMNILKDNRDSPLEYVVSLFNIFCNKNITKKIKIILNTYKFFFEKQHKCSYQLHFVSFVHFNIPYQGFKKSQNSNGAFPFNC